ncbi:DISARM system SNF2-like helicase DrmD [Glycomyces sp. L485]|uniref:DISARM system SNF2-like helicase DrmD n=1 Tax=Glycomyces sp. L485 TaxID=2909235 RepID=UPI001F4B8881|nr:DISARM system SNF2-like helicase DrmD [Glycomyces sp. L485]MCH7231609.1 DISARM system SNF2-like helicase DrmD [Glycomyces sp. L485]
MPASSTADRSEVPSVGDRVEVRDSRWIVADVDASGNDTLVELNSIADDAFGETLRVVWELEPGRRLLPASGLPEVTRDGFDRPGQLAAFLDAMRWSALTSADTRSLQAPFRSGADIKHYQLEPVWRSLRAPRVNQLLADDVGLGKTVEAGLVASELILRHRAKRVMIVCPAGLTTKWEDEMFRLFGLRFTIVNAQTYTDLRRERGNGANPFDIYRHTIVSLPWLRGPKAERLLFGELLRGAAEDTKPFFDLLILDEAHHIAPAAPKQRYAVDSQQTKTMRELSKHFTHRLFLSATPHNGYPESFTALLEILDPARFARGVEPSPAAQQEVVIRRLKSSIVGSDGEPEFPSRQVRDLQLEYGDDELEVHRLFSEFTQARRSRRAKGRRGRAAADLITLLLKKRLLSSPQAFANTYATYAGSLPQEAAAVSDAVPGYYDEFWDESAVLDDEELYELEEDGLRRSAGQQERLDPAEQALLGQINDWALKHLAVPDTKAARLLEFLRATCKADGRWGNDRVVVFTEYRDTLHWLHDLLDSQGFGGDRVALLHGGMDIDEREEIRLAFQADPSGHPLRILLATDAAGEGIDLQNHCNRLVNYDIPFNPNKLEQRAGRIDRYGQRRSPEIYNFVPSQTAGDSAFKGEIDFLARVAAKVSRMQTDLGSVNPVLAEALQKRLAGDSSVPDVDALAERGTAKGRKSGEVAATTDVSEQVERLGKHYDDSVAELHLHPERIRRVVDTALDLAHQMPLKPRPTAQGDPPSEFEVPVMTGEWVRATDGLLTPFVPEGEEKYQRPVSFDPLVASGRDDVVLAHLSHPLVDMSARLLRAAADTDRVDLKRVTAVVGPDELEDVFVAAYAKYTLTGGESTQLHQEIMAVGGWLDSRTGRFRRLENLGRTAKILDDALDGGVEAGPGAKLRLAERWPEADRGLRAALDWRTATREDFLHRLLDNRVAEDQERVRDQYEQFRASLEQAIQGRQTDEHELAGLAELELQQARRDEGHWAERLEQIDAERDRALEAVTARYADPVGHRSPLAIVCVVPERENR